MSYIGTVLNKMLGLTGVNRTIVWNELLIDIYFNLYNSLKYLTCTKPMAHVNMSALLWPYILLPMVYPSNATVI